MSLLLQFLLASFVSNKIEPHAHDHNSILRINLFAWLVGFSSVTNPAETSSLLIEMMRQSLMMMKVLRQCTVVKNASSQFAVP
ncbi:uncharacterized protein GGS22DRAFT_163664 [Annulohypoxylon maeteangense]|uniref:uncharacterized protein n=1 Tax=Annulohypoxylon maeteangense TaxID=1927788 RepID=UPI0020086F1F|nr:uncharacterized protein GGS22DRAFT_163664 [Annulohypoxylon maeteangense]KAI0885420.1 hypothetical protein GGS22DRAFT_163664 [Annulohypoxylon maeteangense]